MGIITNTLKWSVKLGLGGGTVFVAHQAGLFGTADEAQAGVVKLEKDFNDVNENVNKQLTEYVPKEVLDYAPEMPEIPKVDVKEFIPNVDLSFTSDIRGLWNKGVMVVFSGLANSPEAAKVYSSDVVQYVKDQINASEEDPKK